MVNMFIGGFSAWIVFLAPAFAKNSSAAQETYNNHSVIRVVPYTTEDFVSLSNYLQADPTLDVWKNPTASGQPVDIHVSPDQRTAVYSFLHTLGIEPQPFIPNIRNVCGRPYVTDEEEEGHRLLSRGARSFNWNDYSRLDEIYEWMRGLASEHKEVSLIEGGRTFEGRRIFGVKIAFNQNLPIVIIEAGIHAREWIAPATATYFINEVLTNSDDRFKAIVRKYEWHIFPSTNPDGYEYTFTHNRLWRKTRSTLRGRCRGVDPNRNWPFHWNEAGTNVNPCAESYAGPRPESEVETRTFRRYLDSLIGLGRVRVYISLHAYSQLLMFPWGYQKRKSAAHRELNTVAQIAVSALLKRYRTPYRYGTIAELVYLASGSTVDYVHSKGVTFTFALELRDKGRYGFCLPANQIQPTAAETVDAIVAICAEAAKRSGGGERGLRRFPDGG